MINKSDISKDFILNKAVRDATNILLKPYLPVVLSESNSIPNAYQDQYETFNTLKERWIIHSQDFVLRMATIAWDFLNILSMFQDNITHQLRDDDIPCNEN